MIQDIAPKKMRNQYLDGIGREPADTEYVFAYIGKNILCRSEENGELSFPTVAEYRTSGAKEKLLYLFAIGEKAFWLPDHWDEENPIRIEGYDYGISRLLRNIQPKDLCFAGETGMQLYLWYRDSRFCGRCGGKMQHSEKERAMVCPSCGNTVYPKICPAVIIGVTNGDSIMMSHYAGRAYKGNALLAGFCEIGETAEQTVAREVMEEVGLKVKNIRYYKSQPWGFDSDLLMGFYCDLDGNSNVTLDTEELANAAFVKREDIGEEKKDVSLTAEMIMNFKENM